MEVTTAVELQTAFYWFSTLAMQDAVCIVLLVLLFLRVRSLRLFWGMFVRGCARRDLC